MTWRERIAAAWDYLRLKEELEKTQADLAASRAECARLEDSCIYMGEYCEELNDAGLKLSDTLNHAQQKVESLRATLLAFRPTLDSTEKLRQFYNCVASEFDSDGFLLYFAAQEVAGIGSLYDYFPYEDACGFFETAGSRTFLRYLIAARFGAVEWDIVPGTTYEAATLREVDTTTPEYQAFEKQMYTGALKRMGFQDFLPAEPVPAKEKNSRNDRGGGEAR